MIRDNQNTLNKLHIVIDAVLILAAYYLAYPLRFYVMTSVSWFALAPGEGFLRFADYSRDAILLVPGYLVIYSLCGLYRPKRGHSQLQTVGQIFEANLIGIFYFAFLIYILKEIDISRLFSMTFAFLNLLFGLTFRLLLLNLLRSIRRKGHNLKHIILVGYSRAAESFIERIVTNPDWGYQIYGVLDDHMAVGTRYHGVDVIGTTGELDEILEEGDFDEVIISLGLSEYDKLERTVNTCERSGIHTKFVPDYNNMITTVPYIEDLYGLPVINIRNVPLSNALNAFVKRAVDIVVGLVALALFAIPMLIIALIVKLTSPGPALFAQVRVGRHGHEFKMFKFRSMYEDDAEHEKAGWTTKGDRRVTPIGRFIRKTSLDELPQLFNVLVGNMSLVGPRPERPQFVEKFREEIPRYMIKHQVRPGMTGWAQIHGLRGDTSIRKRIDYDLYYIENWSLGLDLKILFATIFKGFINKNAY